MLFKTISVSVYGIDAYLVEEEVDVGSADMNQFVVGLPDNAVKESRERIKAALKNCGFSFPCGYFGDPTRECHCTPPMRSSDTSQKYRALYWSASISRSRSKCLR